MDLWAIAEDPIYCLCHSISIITSNLERNIHMLSSPPRIGRSQHSPKAIYYDAERIKGRCRGRANVTDGKYERV